MRLWIGLAGVNGFLAVLAAAALAHGVEIADMTKARAAIAASATHLTHTVAIFGIGLAAGTIGRSRLLTAAGASFQIGALLFSGALYAYVMTGAPAFAHAAPIGGVAFMLGWLSLLAAAIRGPSPSNAQA